MEQTQDIRSILDYMIQPGFLVTEHKIAAVNEAATGLFLSPGMDVMPLLKTGEEEYREFAGGCLYLTLSLSGQTLGASVTRRKEGDLFLLEQLDRNRQELSALALAARELREPLSNIMITAQSLSSQAAEQEDNRDQASRLNRGLIQMMRIMNNMADAGRYASFSRQEMVDLTWELSEIFEKAEALISYTGITLTYEGLREPVYTLADREQLERAVLNILSNALKFTPEGGRIDVTAVRQGNLVRISIQDSGEGMDDAVRAHLFHRYLRQLSLEDSRFGIGLGMVLIRSAAANHGGTVLVDQCRGTGTRVTMTVAIRQSTDNMLRSPITRVDYAGGHNHTLLELSDCLPLSAFQNEL